VKKSTDRMRIAKGLQPLAVPMAKLRPDPNNANEHSPENIAGIKEQLARMGQLKPIVATEDGIIRAGNGTYTAAKEMGADKIAVVYIPEDLAEHAEAFALADNQLTRISRFNPARLREAIARLRAKGQDPSAAGFTAGTLQAILSKARAAAETEADSNWNGATPSKARSKPGDLWALGEHRLLVGDSRDSKQVKRLMGGRKAQLVFTDPPYGVDYEDAKARKIKNDALKRDNLAALLTAAFKAAVEAAASDAAFYIWHASATRGDFEHALKAAGLEERQYLIWAKPSLVLGRADYQWNHEPCFYASKAGTRPAFYGGRAETTLWRVAALGADAAAVTLGPGVQISDGEGSEITVTAGPSPRKLRHLRVAKGTPLLMTGGGANDGLGDQPRHPADHPPQPKAG